LKRMFAQGTLRINLLQRISFLLIRALVRIKS
jgi:hypothetical protein